MDVFITSEKLLYFRVLDAKSYFDITEDTKCARISMRAPEDIQCSDIIKPKDL